MVTLDSADVEAREISTPSRITRLRLVTHNTSAGRHTLQVISELPGARFTAESVHGLFFTNDWDDRAFLEKYIPTNLEYDNYSMTFDIQIIGTNVLHSVFANGEVTQSSTNSWHIVFPEYFTTSSILLEYGATREYQTQTASFRSVTGRVVPISIFTRIENNYMTTIPHVENVVIRELTELESQFGAWSHPGVLINLYPGRAMEFSGATRVTPDAESLSHELAHSFLGRSFMPASGNDGWLDEALVSWRDDGYRSRPQPPTRRAAIGGTRPTCAPPINSLTHGAHNSLNI